MQLNCKLRKYIVKYILGEEAVQLKNKITITILGAITLVCGEQLVISKTTRHKMCKIHGINTNKDPLVLNLEIADTESKKVRGLSYRSHVPKKEGMLFVFRQPKKCVLWGKNTFIKLDVIFIDHNHRVLETAKIEPQNLKTICSSGPVKFAIEVNSGLVDKYNIRAGHKFSFL